MVAACKNTPAIPANANGKTMFPGSAAAAVNPLSNHGFSVAGAISPGACAGAGAALPRPSGIRRNGGADIVLTGNRCNNRELKAGLQVVSDVVAGVRRVSETL